LFANLFPSTFKTEFHDIVEQCARMKTHPRHSGDGLKEQQFMAMENYNRPATFSQDVVNLAGMHQAGKVVALPIQLHLGGQRLLHQQIPAAWGYLEWPTDYGTECCRASTARAASPAANRRDRGESSQ
jgi:hypothetical protein